MAGGMAKYWIITRVGDKDLPRVGHQLLCCYVKYNDSEVKYGNSNGTVNGIVKGGV